MNIAAKRAKALARGRAAAGTMMAMTVTHRRPTGTTSIDDVTLAETPDYTTIDTDIDASFRASETEADVEPVAGKVVAVDQHVLSIPWDYPNPVLLYDEFVATGAPVPDHVGRRWVVRGLHDDNYSTARRMTVHEVVA